MADMILSSAVPKYKLVFLGDIYVGKTSIINQFMYETFDNNYQATIGIDFLSKTIQMGDSPMRLQLWDTAGQERFRSLIPNYIRDSSAAIIVFDITNTATFTSVEKWIEDVRNERGTDAVIAIVGNKADKTEERTVSKEDAQAKANGFSAIYAETSAKTGMNIKELFRDIAKALGKENTPVTEEKRGVGLMLPGSVTQSKAKEVKRCC
jgi:Ras-related protein Rab-6A